MVITGYMKLPLRIEKEYSVKTLTKNNIHVYKCFVPFTTIKGLWVNNKK